MSRIAIAIATCVALWCGAPAQAEEAAIDVVVEGTPADERPDPTPASYVLGSGELDHPGAGLVDALERVPGVQLRRSGGSADPASASLRGATSAETPVYLAGVKLNDELTGGADISSVPTWMLHHAEVVRGHAPADADELGIGGAIVLEPRLPRGSHAVARWGVGSFGERELSGAMSLGSGDVGTLVALRGARGDGDFSYLDDGGTRFDAADDVERRRTNADHRSVDMWSISRADLGRVSLQTLLNVLVREQGATRLEPLSSRVARARLQRTLSGVRATVPCGEPCSVEVQASAMVTRYRLEDPLAELGLSRRTDNAGEAAAQRVRVTLTPVDWLSVRVGAGQRMSWLSVTQDSEPLERARRYRSRAEVDASARIGERATVVLVSAVECHSTASLEASDQCGVLEPVGRLGAVWRVVSPLALRANVGRYVRVPTLGELYGISSVVRGNSTLEVERGISVDAGATIRHEAQRWGTWAQLFGFARVADSLIGFRRSSIGTVTPYNAASARVLGAELAAGASLWHTVFFLTAVSLTDPRDTSEDRLVASTLLPFQSRLVVAPEIEIRSPPWRRVGLERAALLFRYRHRSSRVADPAGLVVLPADGELDLEAGLGFERTSVRFRLANVLDSRSFDVVGFPLPGRSIHMLGEVRL